MALPNAAGMSARLTVSHLQWTGMSGVIPEPNFIIAPSALLDDPTFFPVDQHWACQARQTKQDMKLIRADETIPLIWPVTAACLISSVHYLCPEAATVFECVCVCVGVCCCTETGSNKD